MKNNNFKKTLHVDVPALNGSSFNTSDTTNLLLSKLGLFPMPENVQAQISDDNKYLNIKLKDSPTEQHILFQFPLKATDFSALNNREDYQELIDRYNLYINDYVDEIKKYATMERAYLQKRFPELVFNIKIRTKSYDSYIRKLNENILEGKNPYINDIIAERIILSEYTGNEERNLLKEKYANNEEALKELYALDEQDLKRMCDEVAKALYDFRIQTKFRMKKDIEPNVANSDKEYITKDYIKHPKKNGYESIHILMEHKNNKDLTYETQIRTFDMENLSKTSGEIAHKKYKPRILNDLSTNRVPIYSEISCFSDEFGKPIIVDIPLENRFYHFYNSDRNDHSNLENSKKSPITYEKFRAEQYELENLLGIEFKQIRKKLRNINLETEKEQNKEAR
ncbi:MAG: hypothetical protein IJE05_02670 [Clostridia bacterium]|nr:hypothetical protein [Clostridia bacterium]